jgi:tetratricopeptide (TPR) repeat protein
LNTDPLILEHIRTGHYTEGHAAFQSCVDPTAEDWAYAGVCLTHVGRMVESREYFTQARARGFEGAAALMGMEYIVHGESAYAWELLAGIDQDKLDPAGIVHTERLHASLLHGEGQLANAMKAIERAWDAMTTPSGRVFRGRVAQLAGLIFSEAGYDARALEFLNVALEGAESVKHAELLTARANAFMHSGRFLQALADLEAVNVEILPPRARLTHRYYRAKLDRARGLETESAIAYMDTVTLARDLSEPEFEAWAHLGLCAIATARDDFPMALAHVQRASALVEPSRAKLQAHVALRHGAILARAGDDAGVTALEMARDAFEQLGHQREAGIANLHLAEALYRLERQTLAADAIRHALEARHRLGSGVVMALELRCLPFVFEYVSAETPRSGWRVLIDDWRHLEPGAREVRITSLGSQSIMLEGKSVQLNSGLAKTVATLGYLLEHGPVSLEKLQAAVFSDELASKSGNYFHLIRREIARALPGVQIPYDRVTQTYKVVTENVRVVWDVLEVRKALSLGGEVGARKAMGLYTGPFLASLESEWVEDTRAGLEWSVAKAGLEALQALFEDARFDACESLAVRVLEIYPFEVGAVVLLSRSVYELRGSLEAKRTLERWQEHFRRQIGEVPPDLLEAGRGWANAVN